MSEGLITKEQALELLSMPSLGISPAAKLQIVMKLLDPGYDLPDDDELDE